MFNKDQSVISKKKAILFTKNVTAKRMMAIAPFNPIAAGLAAGAVFDKFFNISQIEGTLYLKLDRLTFEVGSMHAPLASVELIENDFRLEIILKDVQKISTGRKMLKKTMIISAHDFDYEFSIFFVDSFIEKIEAVLG